MNDNPKKNIQFGNHILKHTVETPTPPRPGFTSPFKTLQEWLFNICDSNQPVESISEYNFGLYETPGNNMVCLVGYNTCRNIEQGISSRRIAFQPSNMFFVLPREEYGNLSQELVRKRILKELIEFTKTSKFKNSFLSKGDSITTDLIGEIWQR